MRYVTGYLMRKEKKKTNEGMVSATELCFFVKNQPISFFRTCERAPLLCPGGLFISKRGRVCLSLQAFHQEANC